VLLAHSDATRFRRANLAPADRQRYQGVMANILAANWKANKMILTNLSICLVTLLIQGVTEQPQRESSLSFLSLFAVF
jgi:hypothetical protein